MEMDFIGRGGVVSAVAGDRTVPVFFRMEAEA
jgi:hypothetical protein